MISVLKKRAYLIFKNYSLPRWGVLLVDLSVVYFSFLIAYLLRYNFDSFPFDISAAFKQDNYVLCIYAFFFLVFKSYVGMIRHTTLKDTYKILYSNFLPVTVLVIITFLARRFKWSESFNIPISILLIHNGAVTVFSFLFRISVRIFYEFASSPLYNRRNALIYGSGDVGILVKRVIDGDPRSGMRLAGFIDDDKKCQGKKVDGYHVYSRAVLSKDFINEEQISTIILALQHISPSRKKEILEQIIDLGCEILDTPSFGTWLNGKFEISKLKKVEFEDLLGREPIQLDLERIKAGLNGKTIMVTGAAGSIGSEISRQLLRFNPKLILLVDQAETPSFYLNEELKDKSTGSVYKMILCDVTLLHNIEKIFIEHKPDIVFHTAAYKHVPLMENQPHEAFRVNVGGTMVLTDLAIKYKVKKFVMVSSDKAVNPTNVMGATKKVCELMVLSQSKRADNNTQFIITRFGNVLGSNGSVIPLFNKQISDGGPITITHPEITRYFMTISEACQLVLEAGFMGNGGQIFVFNMGEPIKILDIAFNLIRLSGLEPYKDIQIKYIGLRPGEKLTEELFAGDEPLLPTYNPKIYIANVMQHNHTFLLEKLEEILSELPETSHIELLMKLKELVPEFDCKQLANIGQPAY